MSLFSIVIRNYRSIPYDNPIEIGIDRNITFIVGINNVGKTNLLRMFYELRPAFASLSPELLKSKSGKYTAALNGVFSDNIINQKFPRKSIEIEIRKEDFALLVKIHPLNNESHTNQCLVSFSVNLPANRVAPIEVMECALPLFQRATLIPTHRIVSNYGSGQARDILVGPDLLSSFTDWSTGIVVEKRLQMKKFVEELRDLFGYRTFELSPSADKSHLIATTDDGSFRLDELGEGIGHFIVVLTNAFLKRPAFILIDEPEIGLHPRMQELFIRTLASKATHGLIAVSHAIGLARSAADTIYSITRDDNKKLHLLPFGQHHPSTIAQSINEMGYSQFAELGGDNLLLVEGRTDIKSFREILRKYGIEHKFIIWTLGGGTFISAEPTKIIEELGDLKRLNPRSISVIFDSERTAHGQALRPEFERFKQTCETLGFMVFATDYHSTENYISQAAIDVVLGNSYQALTPFEVFGTNGNKWQKERNWLMFREMEKSDFANTELDGFVQRMLVPAASKP